VKYVKCTNALPYSMSIGWSTTLPNSNKECKVGLDVKLSAVSAKTGETVRLSATLKNRTSEGLPMTMAIIGLPAGTTAQPWQLKEMQEKKFVDYYETRGNNVIFYYRQMKPDEVKTINLDLKSEIPGVYSAPASCAYLYYTNEFKDWRGLDRLTIDE
jgi:alpha-2-macroglobulin-like protein